MSVCRICNSPLTPSDYKDTCFECNFREEEQQEHDELSYRIDEYEETERLQREYDESTKIEEQEYDESLLMKEDQLKADQSKIDTFDEEYRQDNDPYNLEHYSFSDDD